MTGSRIVIVGDLINDIVAVTREPLRPDTDTTATIRPSSGGSAANTAVWLARAGAAVDFVAAVGAHDAHLHEEELAEAGVTPHLQVEVAAPTGTIIIIVQGSERTMLTERGANSLLTSAAVTDALLADAALLHVSGYSIVDGFRVAGTRALLDRAAAAGVPVSVNPGSIGFIADFGVEAFLEAIAGASLLFLSGDEARLLTGLDGAERQARALARDFPIVALTRGAEGVLLVVDGGEPVAIPARSVRAIDPTGAGDAFIGGFLASWTQAPDAVAAAEAGVFTAARAVMAIGGRPPI
ncbi:carbohydrate kinase family protein [Protaetiibacter intestinalis]|uniref:carbohydrate kinase family protein n=1 Tax=Protaetiibacter intestinalis TaxID=2419774 RepID=UPI00130023D3|nr:carbohydrate kinase family protein [Protaetiibacter intestinalis]